MTMAGRFIRINRSLVTGSLLLVYASAAVPCGFEDPASIGTRRGALNIAFPESLHVGTAMWQSQIAGRLPRDPWAQRSDLKPEARDLLRRMWATEAVRGLAARLASDGAVGDRPTLSIVMLSSVMWSRLESQGTAVLANVHVDGPGPGDVVLVTDTPAIAALVDGGLKPSEALAFGLIRLYGDTRKIDVVRRWLGSLERA